VLTNNQIDKIGAKLRAGVIDAECLRNLEAFRGLYVESYRYVEAVLADTMGLKVSGRPSKSTVAIIEKLKRETIRLNQIQDIAGCRVVVPNLAIQDHLVENMRVLLSEVEIDDKRLKPTNGYRAVHVIAIKNGRPVEIQVRTALQHVWADLSEKVADEFGQSIKYGVGDDSAIAFLQSLSDATARLDLVRHKKMAISQEKIRYGKSKEIVTKTKNLSEEERLCMREIRSIFAGKVRG
jgi:putative GTP pyrophosphokinase